MYIVLWIFAFLSAVGSLKSSLLRTQFEWKYFDFDWESESKKNSYILKGDYDYKNNIPVDADRSDDGRTFVTIKAGPGVPATLNTVSKKVGLSGPLLQPYPDWSWHIRNDCDVITSVYHIAIDSCDRLWVLDSGKISGEYICPAQLLAFNLHTDQLEFRKKIPPNAAEDKYGNGLLYNLIVNTDDGGFCNNTKVFMADARGYGLVVWDGLRLFRVEGKVFEPEEKYTKYSIAGEKFHLADGVRGMALSPAKNLDNDRYLFFRPLASKSLYAANLQDLAKVENRKRMNYFGGIDILPSQASSLAFSSNGTLFYGLTKEIGIGCWNMHNPLTPNYLKLALTDKERLQFISGLKLIHSRFLTEPQEELLILSNRLQKVYGSSLDYNEINFRVLRLSVKALINGTNCDTYN